MKHQLEARLLRYAAEYSRYMNGRGEEPTDGAADDILDLFKQFLSSKHYNISDRLFDAGNVPQPEIATELIEMLTHKIDEDL